MYYVSLLMTLFSYPICFPLISTTHKTTGNQLCSFKVCFFLFQINLRLILVSGKTKDFFFSPSDSAGDIAQHVFENWPEGKEQNVHSLSALL